MLPTVNLRQVDRVKSDGVQISFFICDPKIHSVIQISMKVLKNFHNTGGVDDFKLSYNIWGIGDVKHSRNVEE